jgi:hypothetical protein
MSLPFGLLLIGLALAFVAQVLAYLSGERNWKRRTALAFGIIAVVFTGWAGHLANERLGRLVAFVFARGA